MCSWFLTCPVCMLAPNGTTGSNLPGLIIGEVTLSSENPEAVIAAANTLIDNTKRSIGLLKRLSTVLHGGREGLTNTVFTFFARVKGYLWEIATIPETANEDSLSQKSVTALVQDIHKAGGEVIDATEGSVLLHIQCHSVNELLDVLNYFKSSDIDQRLDFIAECLTEELGCRISLSACIQVESLQEAFHLIQEKQNPVFTKRVLLSIKCEKSEGVLNVVKLFEDGDASNKLSTISNDLSDELGSPVVLRASLDTDTLHEYVHATKGNQFEQGETQQSVMRYEPLVEIKAHDSLSKESTEKE
ncbi:uncharacterized protein LOC128552181, partial [Mercenaria mercenaria]|uniref:uncharacterized protein LOC128552181 n=1 Tax=Mercenaria mercenaria TaxID=6596 RepID=UPI00234EFB07